MSLKPHSKPESVPPADSAVVTEPSLATPPEFPEDATYPLQQPSVVRPPVFKPLPKKRGFPQLDSFFTGHLPLESETTWFIAVSMIDCLLTWHLITGDVHFESNPVAAFFINRWGAKGLVGFKFGMVTFICVLTQVIARYNIEWARRILWYGIFVVAAVVVYSSMLIWTHSHSL
jgi:hypothetical protein